MRPPGDSPNRTILHATAVALGNDAVVIRGAAGSGKSSLALQLIALGARLVSDDRTVLTRAGPVVTATAPDTIRGLIEARGAGLLSAPTAAAARVALVVDLDRSASERLPAPVTSDILGRKFPLIYKLDGPQFAATVFAALRFGAPGLPPEPQPDATMPSELELTSAGPARVIFVTGPSGAGRMTAIAALEDLGFETIDNLPLSFLPRLFDGHPLDRPLALGVDVRNRDFSAEAFLAALDRLSGQPGLWAEALFLDARPDVLSRRYSETRRRHPLAPGETPEDGILREIEVLAPIRARADVLIDTSETTPHELRAELERLYGSHAPGLSVSVQSFSFKRGLPRGLDMVFDVRFLQNPHWQPELRPFTGLDPRVSDHVAGDPKYPEFFVRVRDLMLFLLPAYADEGKTYFAVGFGCTGGKHRSVTLAEKLSTVLADAGWAVSTRHRELERRGEPRAPAT